MTDTVKNGLGRGLTIVSTPMDESGLQPAKPASKKKAKVEEPALPEKFGAVLYTDGGSRPNPGPTGCSYHGYYYQILKPKKGAGAGAWVLTNQGYVKKQDIEEKAVKLVEFDTEAKIDKAASTQGEVTPVHYFDGFGSYGQSLTNNVGEIDAAYRALVAVSDYVLDHVRIITDSQMVYNAATKWRAGWEKANYLTKEGTIRPNSDLWKRLFKVADDLAAKCVNVEWEWIKSHTGHIGNEAADAAATAGVYRSIVMQREGKMLGVEFDALVTPADGYWKVNNEKHPFLFNRRNYFNDNPAYHRPGHYYMGDHGKVDALLGTRNSEGSIAVVRLGTPEPKLEQVIRLHQDMFNRRSSGLEHLVFSRVDHIFSPAMYRWTDRYGDSAMSESRELNGLQDLSNPPEPVSTIMTPAGISGRVVDELCGLEVKLDKLLTVTKEEELNATGFATTDLVPLLYESSSDIDKKTGIAQPVLSLKSEYNTGFAVLETPVNYVHFNEDGSKEVKQVSIRLQLGVDMPDRNALKRLEPYLPKLKVVTWFASADCIRYAVYGVTEKDCAIWAGVYSNLRFLKEAGESKKKKVKTK